MTPSQSRPESRACSCDTSGALASAETLQVLRVYTFIRHGNEHPSRGDMALFDDLPVPDDWPEYVLRRGRISMDDLDAKLTYKEVALRHLRELPVEADLKTLS